MGVKEEVRGFVRAKIWGSNKERFLSICANHDMLFWDLEIRGKYLFVNMYTKDFWACKNFVRKTGIRVVIVEKHGLPFFIRKLSKRIYFVIGFVLFLLVWQISIRMLWHIRVEGNYSITIDQLEDFLLEQNISIGMWTKDIDIEQIEKQLREEFPVVTWTSGRLDGTVFIIDLKENEKPEQVKEEEVFIEGSSLYATVDGILYSVFVRNGISMKKAGDPVVQGELIVDGKVPVYLEDGTVKEFQTYEADADIWIKTNIPIHYQVDPVFEEKKYTGRVEEGSFFTAGNKIYPLQIFANDFVYYELSYQYQSRVDLGDWNLGFGKYSKKEYILVERNRDETMAETVLLEELEKNITGLEEKGVQIIQKNVTIDLIMDKWVLQGNLEVLMPGVESGAITYLEENGENNAE